MRPRGFPRGPGAYLPSALAVAVALGLATGGWSAETALEPEAGAAARGTVLAVFEVPAAEADAAAAADRQADRDLYRTLAARAASAAGGSEGVRLLEQLELSPAVPGVPVTFRSVAQHPFPGATLLVRSGRHDWSHFPTSIRTIESGITAGLDARAGGGAGAAGGDLPAGRGTGFSIRLADEPRAHSYQVGTGPKAGGETEVVEPAAAAPPIELPAFPEFQLIGWRALGPGPDVALAGVATMPGRSRSLVAFLICGGDGGDGGSTGGLVAPGTSVSPGEAGMRPSGDGIWVSAAVYESGGIPGDAAVAEVDLDALLQGEAIEFAAVAAGDRRLASCSSEVLWVVPDASGQLEDEESGFSLLGGGRAATTTGIAPPDPARLPSVVRRTGFRLEIEARLRRERTPLAPDGAGATATLKEIEFAFAARRSVAATEPTRAELKRLLQIGGSDPWVEQPTITTESTAGLAAVPPSGGVVGPFLLEGEPSSDATATARYLVLRVVPMLSNRTRADSK